MTTSISLYCQCGEYLGPIINPVRFIHIWKNLVDHISCIKPCVCGVSQVGDMGLWYKVDTPRMSNILFCLMAICQDLTCVFISLAKIKTFYLNWK